MEETTKKYTEGNLTVIWKPHKCIHSEKCYKGLPSVFNPDRKPWIDPSAEDPDIIRKQIRQCPSGALSYSNMESQSSSDGNITRAEVIPNGPLMIYGPVAIEREGNKETKSSKTTAFCRCGASGNKPFCDGSHKKAGFEG